MFKSTEQGERRAWAELRLNNEDNFLLRLLTSLMNLRAEVAVITSEQEPNSAHLHSSAGRDAKSGDLLPGEDAMLMAM